MKIETIPKQLRVLADAVDEWRPRAYRPGADYCTVTLWAQGTFDMPLEQFNEQERQRGLDFAINQERLAGILLSDAFDAGTFSDLRFIDLIDTWRWYEDRRREAGSSHILAEFFRSSILNFYLMQVDGNLDGCEFPVPPWKPYSQDEVPPGKMLERYLPYLAGSIRSTATLIESLTQNKVTIGTVAEFDRGYFADVDGA